MTYSDQALVLWPHTSVGGGTLFTHRNFSMALQVRLHVVVSLPVDCAVLPGTQEDLLGGLLLTSEQGT